MKRYKFTATAEKDLLGIVDYSLEKWGDIKAAQYVDGLESFASNLANNPNVGLYQGDIFADIRAFPYESHILYYVSDSQGITIIRVLHKRMNPHLHL